MARRSLALLLEGPPAFTVSKCDARKGCDGRNFIPLPPLSADYHPACGVLYLRFTLTYRDVEELLAERALDISYQSVRKTSRIMSPGNALWIGRLVSEDN